MVTLRIAVVVVACMLSEVRAKKTNALSIDLFNYPSVYLDESRYGLLSFGPSDNGLHCMVKSEVCSRQLFSTK